MSNYSTANESGYEANCPMGPDKCGYSQHGMCAATSDPCTFEEEPMEPIDPRLLEAGRLARLGAEKERKGAEHQEAADCYRARAAELRAAVETEQKAQGEQGYYVKTGACQGGLPAVATAKPDVLERVKTWLRSQLEHEYRTEGWQRACSETLLKIEEESAKSQASASAADVLERVKARLETRRIQWDERLCGRLAETNEVQAIIAEESAKSMLVCPLECGDCEANGGNTCPIMEGNEAGRKPASLHEVYGQAVDV